MLDSGGVRKVSVVALLACGRKLLLFQLQTDFENDAEAQ